MSHLLVRVFWQMNGEETRVRLREGIIAYAAQQIDLEQRPLLRPCEICMYVCTYVCVYIYIYVCMYVYMYACMHDYMNKFVHVCPKFPQKNEKNRQTDKKTGRQKDREAEKQKDNHTCRQPATARREPQKSGAVFVREGSNHVPEHDCNGVAVAVAHFVPGDFL
jgi:hypothetical protein